MTDVVLRETAADSLAALAELVDRSVRVRWTHERALVHVEGESRPRWIDASRIVAVVPNGKARAAGTAGPVTGPEKEIR